jgi:hypothetical protein
LGNVEITIRHGNPSPEDRQFQKALEYGAITILKHLNYSGGFCETAHVRVLEYFRNCAPNNWERLTRAAIVEENMEKLQHLVNWPNYPKRILKNMESLILRTENPEFFTFWCQQTGKDFKLSMPSTIPVLKWLISNKKTIPNHFLFIALEQKEFTLFELICGVSLKHNSGLAAKALIHGYQSLGDLQSGTYTFRKYDICEAIRANLSIETILWMYSHCNDKFVDCYWYIATQATTPVFMEWILEKITKEKKIQKLWSRMERTTLENAQWFYQKNSTGLKFLLHDFPKSTLVCLWALEKLPQFTIYIYQKALEYNVKLAKILYEKYDLIFVFPTYSKILLLTNVELLEWSINKKHCNALCLFSYIDSLSSREILKTLLTHMKSISKTEMEIARCRLTESVYRYVCEYVAANEMLKIK